MAKAYLSLGSNIGDERNYLSNAVSEIEKIAEIEDMSSVYETPPWGKIDQNRFLNLCLMINTKLSAINLLRQLKKIEKKLGRKTREKWAEREIDIDILFYDSEIMDDDGLSIPHPALHERAFVLVPLSEIAPSFLHPELKLTTQQLLDRVGTIGIKKIGKL